MALRAGSFGKVIDYDARGWALPLLVGLGLGAMLGALFVIARRPRQAQPILPPSF